MIAYRPSAVNLATFEEPSGLGICFNYGCLTPIAYYANIVDAMIRQFADPETEKLFRRLRSRRLPAEIQRRALRKLLLINAAEDLRDLRIPPSNRLKKLIG